MEHLTRRILIVDGSIITVPLESAAQRALERWLFAHVEEVRAVLAPFGLDPNEVELPTFVRVVYRDELHPAPVDGKCGRRWIDLTDSEHTCGLPEHDGRTHICSCGCEFEPVESNG
ncbi:hypothetical protein [Microbacterium candidum]|uniref:Uncharacterized protein n=1 Tax=Microbacterium candidum TaxID=3041922 RepID=A0ABT7MWM3_9MICO|nr:hypothetical protein [Microbacterium sp. ASV49]MDL9978842.1 hypothetical protein [Microbacterium sp. ASV49]